MSAEKQDPKAISDEKAEVFNRQVCEMVSIFFKEVASISADDIYKIASEKKVEGNTVLLEAINRVFSQFIKNGEGLPRRYFDSYARTVDQLVHTFKLNITNKLEENFESIIKLAVRKTTSEDVSYTDIVRLLDTSVAEEPDTPTQEVQ